LLLAHSAERQGSGVLAQVALFFVIPTFEHLLFVNRLWVFVFFLLFSEPFRGFIQVAIAASIHSFFSFVELLYLIGFQPKDSSSGSSKFSRFVDFLTR
jgi:hypothetical protein